MDINLKVVLWQFAAILIVIHPGTTFYIQLCEKFIINGLCYIVSRANSQFNPVATFIGKYLNLVQLNTVLFDCFCDMIIPWVLVVSNLVHVTWTNIQTARNSSCPFILVRWWCCRRLRHQAAVESWDIPRNRISPHPLSPPRLPSFRTPTSLYPR